MKPSEIHDLELQGTQYFKVVWHGPDNPSNVELVAVDYEKPSFVILQASKHKGYEFEPDKGLPFWEIPEDGRYKSDAPDIEVISKEEAERILFLEEL